MKVYTVHRRSRGILVEPEIEFVREGFTWGAAIFGFVWALWHRMWWTALGLFAIQGLVAYLLHRFEPEWPAEPIVMITVMLLIGWAADDLRRAALTVRGFVPVGIVAAETGDAAERRFFEKTGLMA